MNRKQYEQAWNDIYKAQPVDMIHAVRCNEAYRRTPRVLDPETATDFQHEYARAIRWMTTSCGNFLMLPEGFNDAWRKHERGAIK